MPRIERLNLIHQGFNRIAGRFVQPVLDRIMFNVIYSDRGEGYVLRVPSGTNAFFLKYKGLDLVTDTGEHIQILKEEGCQGGTCTQIFYERGDVYGNAERPRLASKVVVGHVRGDDTIPEFPRRDAFEFNDQGQQVAGGDDVVKGIEFVRNRLDELSKDGFLNKEI